MKQVIKDWKPIYKIAEVSGVFLGGIMLVLIFRGGFDVMRSARSGAGSWRAAYAYRCCKRKSSHHRHVYIFGLFDFSRRHHGNYIRNVDWKDCNKRKKKYSGAFNE